MVASDHTGLDVPYTKMYKEIISYSVPFVIVSLNFPLFNLVDQFTHNNALDAAGFHANKDYFFTILNFTTNGVLMYITVPASLGIMALSSPLYTVFYQYNPDGNKILFYYAPVAILISLLSVTASMLQGINKQN